MSFFRGALGRVTKGIFALLLVSLCAPVVADLSEKQLSLYDRAIFLDPESAYQELIKNTAQTELQPPNQVWLLLRKAQAEHTLSLDVEMQATLAQLQPYQADMKAEQQATLHYLSGVSAHKKGALSLSVTELEKAIAIAGENPKTSIYALAIRELGYVHALSGDYYKANLVLHQAYKELVSQNNVFFNGLLEESLGDTYNYSGNYQDSVTYYQGALSYFEKLKYKPFIASTLLGLATVKRRLGQWDDALATFDRYEDALSFSANFSEHYYLQYGRAMTWAEKGDCQQAIASIDQALNMQGYDDYDAELYKKRALCNAESGNLEEAQQDLANARKILQNIEELLGTHWLLELDYIEGVLAAKKDNFESAFNIIDKYYKDNLDLQQRSNSERISRMQKTMEAERKDKEIALLKQNAQLQVSIAREQSLLGQRKNLLLFGALLLMAGLGAFVVFQYRHARKLLNLSICDDLTGLHNRRYFFEHFKRLLKSDKSGYPEFALIAFDIDDFKQINDVWGHQAGDGVIQDVAKLAAAAVGSEDVISRIGGDEFLIVLPGASVGQARDVASSLLTSIANHRFACKGCEQVNVSVSLGITHFEHGSGQELDVDKLVESADQALYQSKRAGKNRYTVAA